MADTETRHDGWRCFHCEEHFPDTEEGRRAARDHFGDDPFHSEPACIMQLNGGERFFLRECIRMQSEIARCYDEDSDTMRLLSKKTSEHGSQLRQAEEAGYARGLRDAPDLWQSPSALHGMRVIWSREHSAWWRAKSAGYCSELFGAGLYTPEEAEKICQWEFSDRAPEVHFDAVEKWRALIGDISPGCLLSQVINGPSKALKESEQ